MGAAHLLDLEPRPEGQASNMTHICHIVILSGLRLGDAIFVLSLSLYAPASGGHPFQKNILGFFFLNHYFFFPRGHHLYALLPHRCAPSFFFWFFIHTFFTLSLPAPSLCSSSLSNQWAPFPSSPLATLQSSQGHFYKCLAPQHSQLPP